jgi:hypothetical protein
MIFRCAKHDFSIVELSGSWLGSGHIADSGVKNHDREPFFVGMVIEVCPLALDKGIPV